MDTNIVGADGTGTRRLRERAVLGRNSAGVCGCGFKKTVPRSALMQTILMQCAAYGLSTDRLTSHPFNLSSNASSTHTSISQTQLLDMTLSTSTQLLWSTMARPVLIGTCPVKPLYASGHRAAAQFQGLGNLLIAFAIFFRATILIFRSSEFFAMRSHV